ncbi:MAG: hypothetical protein NTV01_18410 [Bacteroidia bacterium]|nr:hypothetical protein [Bacteroidia bacterium]
MLRLRASAKYLAILVILIGCRKIVDYPDIPVISFTSVITKDSADVLDNPVKRVTATFHLTDGNGDMGLKNTDTIGPFNKDSAYYFNLFMQEYKKENDSFTEVPAPGGLKKYRIPDLTPSGQNKTLIADISVTIEYPYSIDNPLPFNEFRYEFYVVDRSLNISNKATSSVIIW